MAIPWAAPDLSPSGGIGDLRQGEVIQRATKLAAGVAKLEAARQNDGQGGAGNDAELAGKRDGAGQRPTGHRKAHPTLYDQGL